MIWRTGRFTEKWFVVRQVLEGERRRIDELALMSSVYVDNGNIPAAPVPFLRNKGRSAIAIRGH